MSLQNTLTLKKKLPRKSKHWEKEVFEALQAASHINKEGFFGILVDKNDPSELARDRDSMTALGVLNALMARGISDKLQMQEIRLAVYRHIFNELEQNLVNHPGEMFVSAYLYTHVALNILSNKKYQDIAADFTDKYSPNLGWDKDEYTRAQG